MCAAARHPKSNLAAPERLLLFGLRHWVQAARSPASGNRFLRHQEALFAAARELGGPDALDALDGFMAELARHSKYRIDIRCPCYLDASTDERRLLAALANHQRAQCCQAQDGLDLYLHGEALERARAFARHLACHALIAGYELPLRAEDMAGRQPVPLLARGVWLHAGTRTVH